jgi:hypothetical protein
MGFPGAVEVVSDGLLEGLGKMGVGPSQRLKELPGMVKVELATGKPRLNHQWCPRLREHFTNALRKFLPRPVPVRGFGDHAVCERQRLRLRDDGVAGLSRAGLEAEQSTARQPV